MSYSKRFPILFEEPNCADWLLMQVQLGLAHNTIIAYGHALTEFIHFCRKIGIDPCAAKQKHIIKYLDLLRWRPSGRGAYKHIGLANATIQQRITAVRLFYDYLLEEDICVKNPVRRGVYSLRQRSRKYGKAERGLVPTQEKEPWIPTEEDWNKILTAAKAESIRNRFMLALAYDGALRRAELCSLKTEDFDPSDRILQIRAATTKTRRGRLIRYSEATALLYRAYLQHRQRFSKKPGLLFLSESRRNRTQPITIWTWAKVVKAIALRAGLPHLSTHTLRHLRLTDLARSHWEVMDISRFAGHRNPTVTEKYIHLSGRELYLQFEQTQNSIQSRHSDNLNTLLV